MNKLKKSVEIAGNVFGLLIGDKFTTPAEETLKKRPDLSLYTNTRPF